MRAVLAMSTGLHSSCAAGRRGRRSRCLVGKDVAPVRADADTLALLPMSVISVGIAATSAAALVTQSATGATRPTKWMFRGLGGCQRSENGQAESSLETASVSGSRTT